MPLVFLYNFKEKFTILKKPFYKLNFEKLSENNQPYHEISCDFDLTV